MPSRLCILLGLTMYRYHSKVKRSQHYSHAASDMAVIPSGCRSTLREGLLPQIQALEGSVQGEHAVEYVQMSTSSLGIKIVPRGGTAAARLGVVVSEKDIRIVPEDTPKPNAHAYDSELGLHSLAGVASGCPVALLVR